MLAPDPKGAVALGALATLTAHQDDSVETKRSRRLVTVTTRTGPDGEPVYSFSLSLPDTDRVVAAGRKSLQVTQQAGRDAAGHIQANWPKAVSGARKALGSLADALARAAQATARVTMIAAATVITTCAKLFSARSGSGRKQ